jgi:hypothetical protein
MYVQGGKMRHGYPLLTIPHRFAIQGHDSTIQHLSSTLCGCEAENTYHMNHCTFASCNKNNNNSNKQPTRPVVSQYMSLGI